MEKFLYWMARRNGEWYGLNDLDLIEKAPKHPGVYMIWVEGELIPNEDRVIHSGQTSDISKRLSQHQSDPAIIGHAEHNILALMVLLFRGPELNHLLTGIVLRQVLEVWLIQTKKTDFLLLNQSR